MIETIGEANMRELFDLDKAQLHRLDQAIAALAMQPPAERRKKIHLLRALENEKEELIRCNPAARLGARRFKSAA